MTTSNKRKKKLIINLFDNGGPVLQWHQWPNPRDRSHELNTIEYWQHLAKLAEKGKLTSIFIADSLAVYDTYQGPSNFRPAAKTGVNFPKHDISLYITAMAAVTKNVGFGMTFSTISEHPYHLARRLATLDHLTKGRIGWNIVSSFLPSSGRQLLNGEPLPDHHNRYAKTEEYLKVTYKLLLSSWRDDALKLDYKKGVFADPELIREINHEGNHFNVAGPSITEPSPQRFPLIIQAGSSKAGKEFAAEHAELVFMNGLTPELLGEKISSVKKIALEEYNRNPDTLKFVTLVTAVLGKTHEEAVSKYEELKKYTSSESSDTLFGGWTGIDLSEYDIDQPLEHVESNGMKSYIDSLTITNPGQKFTRRTIEELIDIGGSCSTVFVGTPKEVADQIEHWVDVSDVDGFNFTYAVWPETFEDLVDLLIPELQARGLAQTEYPVANGTFREQFYGVDGQRYLPSDHVGSKYQWHESQTLEEFEQVLKTLE